MPFYLKIIYFSLLKNFIALIFKYFNKKKFRKIKEEKTQKMYKL